jgi:hypothetical protein
MGVEKIQNFSDDFRSEGLFQKKCSGKSWIQQTFFFLRPWTFLTNIFWDCLFSVHFFFNFPAGLLSE